MSKITLKKRILRFCYRIGMILIVAGIGDAIVRPGGKCEPWPLALMLSGLAIQFAVHWIEAGAEPEIKWNTAGAFIAPPRDAKPRIPYQDVGKRYVDMNTGKTGIVPATTDHVPDGWIVIEESPPVLGRTTCPRCDCRLLLHVGDDLKCSNCGYRLGESGVCITTGKDGR